MSRIYKQSHAPKVIGGNSRLYSRALPPGYNYVLDRDGKTYLTDDAGMRLVVSND